MIVSQNSSGSPPSYTWATKPTASGLSGQLIRLTDVGVNGSLWFSNGTKWVHESPIVYQQAAKGWLVPSLAAANAATYSQTGTTITVTSVGHNIPATAHDGKDIYLAIASGDAAAGWFTNFTRTGVDTFTCESSVSQTTSGAVNTNTASNTLTPVTKTIFGGLMGANGSLRSELQFSWFASVNNKNIKARFGGNNYYNVNHSTSGNLWITSRTLHNKNSESLQIAQMTTTVVGGVFTTPTTTAVDTANDFNHDIQLSMTAANEFISLEYALLEVLPS